MFKALYLENIQSHHKSELEFSPGVNMIIGPSDHGKSAIFNGFYKILYNRPSGDEWRTWGTKKSLISLEVDNYTIEYVKQGQAVYTLKDNNTQKQIEFKAFGQTVPQEIQTVLNMDRKINVQQQLERGVPIFLIAESPGDVAKHFNSVAGFDLIDFAIHTGKTQIKETEKRIQELSFSIQNKEKELQKYEGYQDLEDLVCVAEEQEQELLITKARERSITDHVSRIKENKARLNPITKKLKLNIFIKQGSSLYNKVKEQEQKQEKVAQCLANIRTLEKQEQKMSKKMEIGPLVDRALTFFKILKGKEDKKEALEQRIYRITDGLKKVKGLRANYAQTRLKYNELMPEKCPICGGKTNAQSPKK